MQFLLVQPFPCSSLVTHGDCPGDLPAPADSYFPRKSLLVLTLPLSWIRPSKEKAICAKGCKDQGTVTKQKCSLLFSPAIAYAVAESCEKFFAHIAMDVLKRNCSIVWALCESCGFSSLVEATRPMNSTYAYLLEVVFQFHHLQCFMKLFITFLPFFTRINYLPCSSLSKPQQCACNKLLPPIFVALSDLSWT